MSLVTSRLLRGSDTSGILGFMPDKDRKNTPKADSPQQESQSESKTREPVDAPKEIGGRGGLDPTRYGDWEKAGRCIDF